MPDWKQIVRKNLLVLGICSPELAVELADHLEDSYEAFLREGLPAEVAFHRTVSQVEGRRKGWLALRLLQEDIMTGFTRKIALPGLLTFALAMVIARALDLAHVHPQSIFLANGLFLPVPIAWLCLLPFCGAAGALVSHRSGGSPLHGITASLFPSAIMGTVLLLILVAGFAISRFTPDSGWNWGLVVPALALWMLSCAVISAMFLALGAGVAERAKRTRASAN
jgi:hypothetical protein